MSLHKSFGYPSLEDIPQQSEPEDIYMRIKRARDALSSLYDTGLDMPYKKIRIENYDIYFRAKAREFYEEELKDKARDLEKEKKIEQAASMAGNLPPIEPGFVGKDKIKDEKAFDGIAGKAIIGNVNVFQNVGKGLISGQGMNLTTTGVFGPQKGSEGLVGMGGSGVFGFKTNESSQIEGFKGFTGTGVSDASKLQSLFPSKNQEVGKTGFGIPVPQNSFGLTPNWQNLKHAQDSFKAGLFMPQDKITPSITEGTKTNFFGANTSFQPIKFNSEAGKTVGFVGKAQSEEKKSDEKGILEEKTKEKKKEKEKEMKKEKEKEMKKEKEKEMKKEKEKEKEMKKEKEKEKEKEKKIEKNQEEKQVFGFKPALGAFVPNPNIISTQPTDFKPNTEVFVAPPANFVPNVTGFKPRTITITDEKDDKDDKDASSTNKSEDPAQIKHELSKAPSQPSLFSQSKSDKPIEIHPQLYKPIPIPHIQTPIPSRTDTKKTFEPGIAGSLFNPLPEISKPGPMQPKTLQIANLITLTDNSISSPPLLSPNELKPPQNSPVSFVQNSLSSNFLTNPVSSSPKAPSKLLMNISYIPKPENAQIFAELTKSPARESKISSQENPFITDKKDQNEGNPFKTDKKDQNEGNPFKNSGEKEKVPALTQKESEKGIFSYPSLDNIVKDKAKGKNEEIQLRRKRPKDHEDNTRKRKTFENTSESTTSSNLVPSNPQPFSLFSNTKPEPSSTSTPNPSQGSLFSSTKSEPSSLFQPSSSSSLFSNIKPGQGSLFLPQNPQSSSSTTKSENPSLFTKSSSDIPEQTKPTLSLNPPSSSLFSNSSSLFSGSSNTGSLFSTPPNKGSLFTNISNPPLNNQNSLFGNTSSGLFASPAKTQAPAYKPPSNNPFFVQNPVTTDFIEEEGFAPHSNSEECDSEPEKTQTTTETNLKPLITTPLITGGSSLFAAAPNKSLFSGFTTDSNKEKPLFQCFAAESNKEKPLFQSFATDSNKEKPLFQGFTTDSNKEKPLTQSFTTDSNKEKPLIQKSSTENKNEKPPVVQAKPQAISFFVTNTNPQDFFEDEGFAHNSDDNA
ncbi:hypothetical protein SteCoe_17709 [Stentor coeruleus]|uniref:Uncharacterized protein n=1 Tax=Stentor coeruleus TaxID=5963 RepID=A0A1R2BYP6_9CILI|nr:hypothetical protein SteCoe_17709 [Stentor coeruleus]